MTAFAAPTAKINTDFGTFCVELLDGTTAKVTAIDAAAISRGEQVEAVGSVTMTLVDGAWTANLTRYDKPFRAARRVYGMRTSYLYLAQQRQLCNAIAAALLAYEGKIAAQLDAAQLAWADRQVEDARARLAEVTARREDVEARQAQIRERAAVRAAQIIAEAEAEAAAVETRVEEAIERVGRDVIRAEAQRSIEVQVLDGVPREWAREFYADAFTTA